MRATEQWKESILNSNNNINRDRKERVTSKGEQKKKLQTCSIDRRSTAKHAVVAVVGLVLVADAAIVGLQPRLQVASSANGDSLAPVLLRLVAGESIVVEALPRSGLRPLPLRRALLSRSTGLTLVLPTTEATGTLRRRIAHGRARKSGRGSGRRCPKVTLLAAILGYR